MNRFARTMLASSLAVGAFAGIAPAAHAATPTVAQKADPVVKPGRVLRYGPNACDRKVTEIIKGKEIVVTDYGGGKQATPTATVKAIRNAGFKPKDQKMAIQIAAAESSLCPKVWHKNYSRTTGNYMTTDYGMWQINTYWNPKYKTWNLYNVNNNAVAAKQIFTNAGSKWTPWWARFAAYKYDKLADRYLAQGSRALAK